MPKEKLHKITYVIHLTDEEYGQVMAKADHDNIKPQDVIQEAVEVYFSQLSGENIIMDPDLLISVYQEYLEGGFTAKELKEKYHFAGAVR